MGVAYSTNELAHIATRNLIGTALTVAAAILN